MIMSGPIRKTISIVDKDVSPGSYDHIILSVELLPGGFSFALSDSLQLRYYSLEVFQADKPILSQQSIVKLLRSLVKSTSYLQQPYKRINLACFFQPLVLVPGNVHDREEQEAAYQFSCKLPMGHSLRVDSLSRLDAFGIFAIPDDVQSFLDEVFPSNKMVHSGSACIESMISALEYENWHPDMVLHIRSSSFEVILFEKETLRYYKHFPYQDIDDLLYYLFYVLQQLRKDALNMQIMLAGEINVNSNVYDRIASYFKKVKFIGRNETYTFTPGFDSIPNHYYFNLLNLNSCV